MRHLSRFPSVLPQLNRLLGLRKQVANLFRGKHTTDRHATNLNLELVLEPMEDRMVPAGAHIVWPGSSLAVPEGSHGGLSVQRTESDTTVWTRVAVPSGSHHKAGLSSGGSGAVSTAADVPINVGDGNENPVIVTPIGDQTNNVGDTVMIIVHAVDPDGDPITYSANGLPPGVFIDPQTGVIAGTIAPGADAGSPYNVTITASDPFGGQSSVTITWTVK
jgi:hypothetical protein